MGLFFDVLNSVGFIESVEVGEGGCLVGIEFGKDVGFACVAQNVFHVF